MIGVSIGRKRCSALDARSNQGRFYHWVIAAVICIPNLLLPLIKSCICLSERQWLIMYWLRVYADNDFQESNQFLYTSDVKAKVQLFGRTCGLFSSRYYLFHCTYFDMNIGFVQIGNEFKWHISWRESRSICGGVSENQQYHLNSIFKKVCKVHCPNRGTIYFLHWCDNDAASLERCE